VATSLVLWRAERAASQDRLIVLQRWLVTALVAGAAFLVMQAFNWRTMATAVMTTGQDLFTFTYWALTVLHALHVVGGLVPLAITSVRARSGRYGSLNTVPVHNVALYWHFLGVTWVGILIVLLV
jgi:heme/copper-type cytochrome/quinol oxidase subunit 3